MGQKRNDKSSVYYICPYCGNEARPFMKKDTSVRCKFCKSVYTADERVKIVKKH